MSSEATSSVSCTFDDKSPGGVIDALELLNQWGLSELNQVFKAQEITMRSLQYLTEKEIKEIIPKLGLRTVFCAKLRIWRQTNCSKQKEEHINIGSVQMSTSDSSERVLQSVVKIEEPQITEPYWNTEQMNDTLLMDIKPNIDSLQNFNEQNNGCSASSANVQNNNIDDILLLNLLRSWDLEHLYEKLHDSGITLRSLKYLIADDIADVIKHVGYRAEFREKLFIWRKEECGIDDETLSTTSKVDSWLNKEDLSVNNSSGSQSLAVLLKTNAKGKRILQLYEDNSCFTNKQRDELIQIIVDEILEMNAKLRPQNFEQIVNEIITLFPNEKDCQNYYYIARQKNSNPNGKLWHKYCNSKSKRKRFNETVDKSCVRVEPENQDSLMRGESEQKSSDENDIDMNISTLLPLKTCLKEETLCWEELIDIWQKTFRLRQQNLKSIPISDFLIEWPKLKYHRAPELIKHDFDMLYPGHGDLLKNKWSYFKRRIMLYYDLNIRNKQGKDLLISLKTLSRGAVDIEDYIYTRLLHYVLVPTSRFKSADGFKKPSIKDAVKSFILEVDLISDCSLVLDKLTDKYFGDKSILYPFIVVHGSESSSIKSFYVYFDKTLYELGTFIDCLDVCFKIFHTLNLRYPKIAENPWTFIQKFFFEIDTDFDVKSSNLILLLSYMQRLSVQGPAQ